MRKFNTLFALAVVALVAQVATAGTATFSTSSRPVTAAEAGGGAPAGGTVFEFFVTTDLDILSIDQVNVVPAASLFQEGVVGSNVEAPNPALIAVFPALAADSFLTTPGTTNTTGGANPFLVPDSSWFDTDNNGAVTNFKMGQLTFGPNAAGAWTFAGRVNLAGTTVENFPFEFSAIPEPSTLAMASLSLIGLAFRRRNS